MLLGATRVPSASTPPGCFQSQPLTADAPSWERPSGSDWRVGAGE